MGRSQRASHSDGMIDLKYGDEDVIKKFTAAPTPYKLSIASRASEGLDIINIEEISGQ